MLVRPNSLNPLLAVISWIACMLFAVVTALAADTPFVSEGKLLWKNISVDGRKMTVFTTFIDSRGMMWIGCNGGLYSYDGFDTYPVDDYDLVNSQIYAVVERDGRLFIGSNNGVVVYDLTTCRASRPKGDFPSEIRTMVADDSFLWIGSLTGVFRYKFSNGNLEAVNEGLPHRSVYALMYDNLGVLYAGTYNGLAWFDGRKGRFETVDIHSSAPHRNLFINSLAQDSDDGSIWIGTEEGLLRYENDNKTVSEIEPLRGQIIKTLAAGPRNQLVIGTDDGLFIRHSDGTLTRHIHDSRNTFSISDNDIWTVRVDSSGNIWTGNSTGLSMTSDSGLLDAVRIERLTNSGDGNQIYSVLRDRHGDLWLGGSNGLIRIKGGEITSPDGVEWYRPNTGHKISHKRVRSLMEDRNGTMWVATDGGVNRFDRGDDTFSSYLITDPTGQFKANWVYGIIDSGDSLVIGSYLGGLLTVGKSQFERAAGDRYIIAHSSLNTSNGLSNDFVNDLRCDSHGNKWILLFRDSLLTRIDGVTGHRSDINILKTVGAYPTHITITSDDNVWCGFPGGVVAFDSSGRKLGQAHFTGGQDDDGILAMASVDGDVWVSTVSDIWRIDPATFNAELLPLPQKHYTAIYEDRPTGSVLLGATDEVLRISLARLAAIHRNGLIRMLRVGEESPELIFFDSASTTPEISISALSTVNIRVSSLDYSPDAMRRYAYKILKNQADTVDGWTPLPEGSNLISLSNLSIGAHTVAVKEIGPSSPMACFNVVVEAPWYISSMAIAVYIFIFCSLIVWFVYWLRRRSRKKIQAADRQRAIADAENRLSFLANISHDLKTPLSMIIGPLSVMREQTTDAVSRKKMDMMYEHAMKLNNLIHRTVELNHIDASTDSILIMSKIEIVEFCSSIFESYRETHTDKSFVFHALVSRLLIRADAVKLESVLNNLLSNACKYSGEGATISCSVGYREGKAEIIVSDDGVGIPQSEHKLVFQRMFRSARTADMREGTGIGLYLIKKFLELHGGGIELYSREDEGSTFIVTLPVEASLVAESKETERKNNADRSTKKAKILIVEDNDTIASFIRSLLESEYDCTVASNGRSGLAVAASLQPDLIIADEMMPVMTGLEMCRRLKQNPRLSVIPVIMLTAKSDNRTESESVRYGIDVFMRKPFEASILLGRVSHLIEAKRELVKAARNEAMTAPKPVEVESVIEKQFALVTRIIEENISDSDLNVNALAEKSGIGTKQLYRMTKKLVGVSPVDYIRRMRIRKAAILLEQQKFTVSEIMYMVGFKTPSYFAKCFVSEYGCTPSQYPQQKDR